MQSNQIMYSSERLLKLEGKKSLKEIIVQATSLGDIKKETNNNNESKAPPGRAASAKRPKTVDERLPAFYIRSRSAAKIRERERGIGGYVSQYANLQKKDENNTINKLTKTATGKSILRIIFVEKYDLIIGASEDKDIYVWGFDLDALNALKALRDQSSAINSLAEGMFTFFSDREVSSVHIEGEDVANRVVGFTIRRVFRGHDSLVTSLAVVDDVETFGSVFLLSAGWDQRILIWDLIHYNHFSSFVDSDLIGIDEPSPSKNRSIQDAKKATTKKIRAAQSAANGNIHDMDYSPHLKFFAYTASDMCVYVRKFSPTGSEMKLMYTLTTNLDSEIYCVKWNYITNQWVTGMENGEIRLWVFVIRVERNNSF